MSVSNPLTRLSFKPHNLSTDTRRGRRLAAVSDGWRLNGNLHTLGYFAASVCIGSSSTTFELIVDTGSSLAAMPCAGCSSCGHHKAGARFDPGKSTSASSFSCSRPPPSMRCSNCASGSKCGYSVSYTEGSSISGYMVEDKLHLSSDHGVTSVTASFGCQTHETGLFHSQARPPPHLRRTSAAPPPALRRCLHRSRQTPASSAFSRHRPPDPHLHLLLRLCLRHLLLCLCLHLRLYHLLPPPVAGGGRHRRLLQLCLLRPNLHGSTGAGGQGSPWEMPDHPARGRRPLRLPGLMSEGPGRACAPRSAASAAWRLAAASAARLRHPQS